MLTKDNRDMSEVEKYLQARVEALLKRIKELEKEKKEYQKDWRVLLTKVKAS